MERKKVLVFLVISLVFFKFLVYAEESWVLEKDKNGIKCYTRKVEGSLFREYKAEVTVKTTTYSALLALFEDLKNYPKWLESCSEGEIIKRKSMFEYYSYTVSDTPWPIVDRETVAFSTVHQDMETGHILINFRSVDGFKRDPKYVRVKKIEGYWKLIKEGENVKVIYKVHCEPGGKIPSSLVNAFIISQPYNTLLNLRKIVKKSRYQGVIYEDIKE